MNPMMSQQRPRKAGGAAEPIRRQSAVKASGDAMSSNVQAKQSNVRSTSKSKIPKSLRYDLENALVGLCDVWFEEIKPHLVRNNIKVHVHGGGAGPASGDHQRLPPGAPGCSHLDPGAAPDLYQRAYVSCADYCSTQRTASRARCRKPPASCRPACPLPVSSPAKLQASLLNPYRNYEPKTRNSLAGRHPRSQPQPQDFRNWRTPRLCRTYSILTPRTIPPERRLHTADPQMICRKKSKRRPKKKDKSTQTPETLLNLTSKEPWRQDHVDQKISSKQESLGQEFYKKEVFVQDLSKPKVTSPSCLRCPATTNMQRVRKQPTPILPLFQEDLINIIADKNDKQLRVLFKSPTSDERGSTLNLVQAQPPRPLATLKRTPWR